jgi:protein-tyrosine phosphatase
MLNRINFRDYGGGMTSGGKRMRKGLLYRSGILQKLSPADRKHLESLNIQNVVDLRSMEEQEKKPADLPGKNKVSLPCAIDKITRDRLKPLIMKRDANHKIIDVIDSVYHDMVVIMLDPMVSLIRLIITPGALPVMIHCRAGKDRTGFAAALIQWYLGMDREEIIHEYLRSNAFMMPRIARIFKRARLLTIGLLPKGNLQAAFEVREKYMDTVMNRIEKEYGGIENYLLSGGLTPDELNQLKATLLEP